MALLHCPCGEIVKFPSSRAGERIPCPGCGREIDTSSAAGKIRDSSRPPVRPAPMKPGPAAPAASPPRPPASCATCGAPIRPDRAECGRCGASAAPRPAADPQEKERRALENLRTEAGELAHGALMWSLVGILCPPLFYLTFSKGLGSLSRSLQSRSDLRVKALLGMGIASTECAFMAYLFLRFCFAFETAYQAEEERVREIAPSATERRAAQGGPAAGRPSGVPTTPPAPPRKIDPKHREFAMGWVKAVESGDYPAAYALMADAYRAQVPPKDFEKRLVDFRDRFFLTGRYDVAEMDELPGDVRFIPFVVPDPKMRERVVCRAKFWLSSGTDFACGFGFLYLVEEAGHLRVLALHTLD